MAKEYYRPRYRDDPPPRSAAEGFFYVVLGICALAFTAALLYPAFLNTAKPITAPPIPTAYIAPTVPPQPNYAPQAQPAVQPAAQPAAVPTTEPTQAPGGIGVQSNVHIGSDGISVSGGFSVQNDPPTPQPTLEPTRFVAQFQEPANNSAFVGCLPGRQCSPAPTAAARATEDAFVESFK